LPKRIWLLLAFLKSPEIVTESDSVSASDSLSASDAVYESNGVSESEGVSGSDLIFASDAVSESRAAREQIQVWARDNLHEDFLKGLTKFEMIYDRYFPNQLQRPTRKEVDNAASALALKAAKVAWSFRWKGERGKITESYENWLEATSQINKKLVDLEANFPALAEWSRIHKKEESQSPFAL
jgi:hypothetical protein